MQSQKALVFKLHCTKYAAISTRQSVRSFTQRSPTTRPLIMKVQAKSSSNDSDDIGAAGTGAIALGLVANPIVLWSEYTLKTTGAGLQGDILGGIEGISYLVILGIIGWSAYTKAQTGSGLPAGPAGLLGAVEGVSYLSLLAGIIVFGLKALNI